MTAPTRETASTRARKNPVATAKNDRRSIAYRLVLEPGTASREYPSGTVLVMDPDVKPEPGDLVHAIYGEPYSPVIGHLSFQSSKNGITTLVTPLNPYCAAARSDLATLEIVSVMVESTRSRVAATA